VRAVGEGRSGGAHNEAGGENCGHQRLRVHGWSSKDTVAGSAAAVERLRRPGPVLQSQGGGWRDQRLMCCAAFSCRALLICASLRPAALA
ncbi:hypothetical protein J8J40_27190, partial [Mycobacterium tuberculosis]|nr:hypothetical protein [Mycobacterium tuberculosis]MBP0650737.1 hypothetical protein [Mycobacterium tuberculosis]